MSDVNPTGDYHSEINPLFAAAFNKVQAQEAAAAAGQSGEAAGAPAEGAPAPTPGDQGAGAAAGDGAAPGDGTLAGAPSAGDLAAGTGVQTPGAGVQPPASGAGAGSSAPAGAPESPAAGELRGHEAAEVTRILGDAQSAANERLDAAIKNQALSEYRDSINPEILEALRFSPTELVGTEVPSIQRGAQPGTKVLIRDGQQARDYIEGASKLIERGVEDLVGTKNRELQPLRSVIQESFLLFQNNPDIVEGSKTFDKELATRFASMAQSFAFIHNGQTIGYQGNVQPMLNELRTNLAKERGASGERVNAAQRAEQQRQVAAQQQRQPNGQFQGQQPQAGIPSTQGMSADKGEDDDYGAFWQASGAAHLRRGVTPL